MYRDQSVGAIEEGSTGAEQRSILTAIRENIFSRFEGVHLPLLWEPDALEFIPFTLANSTETNEPDERLLGIPFGPPLINPIGEASIDTFGGPSFPGLSEFGGGRI